MKVNLKQVKDGEEFPMCFEILCENLDEFTTMTVACEYPGYQAVLHGINGEKLKAFAQRPKPSMTLPEWMKEIEFENGNVKKQVIKLLEVLHGSLYKENK
jgi:hypothetical protein